MGWFVYTYVHMLYTAEINNMQIFLYRWDTRKHARMLLQYVTTKERAQHTSCLFLFNSFFPFTNILSMSGHAARKSQRFYCKVKKSKGSLNQSLHKHKAFKYLESFPKCGFQRKTLMPIKWMKNCSQCSTDWFMPLCSMALYTHNWAENTGLHWFLQIPITLLPIYITADSCETCIPANYSTCQLRG